jgi:hypothetical protein
VWPLVIEIKIEIEIEIEIECCYARPQAFHAYEFQQSIFNSLSGVSRRADGSKLPLSFIKTGFYTVFVVDERKDLSLPRRAEGECNLRGGFVLTEGG